MITEKNIEKVKRESANPPQPEAWAKKKKKSGNRPQKLQYIQQEKVLKRVSCLLEKRQDQFAPAIACC